MGISKSAIFSERQNNIAGLMKALAHPARIAIIQHLLKTDACVCGDIVAEIGLAQATISQHLKELKNAGLIRGTIEGTSVCYCIDGKNFRAAAKDLEKFFSSALMPKNCC